MKIVDTLIDFVFPPRCACCGELTGEKVICDGCYDELEKTRIKNKVCKDCGLEWAKCECNRFNYLFDGMVVPFYNRSYAQDGVYGMKYLDRPFAADYFGEQIALRFKELFADLKPDMVVIVPTHKDDAKERDYDHVALLGRRIAKELNIEFSPKTIIKTVRNKKQHKLTIAERKANVKGVFKVKERLDEKCILLVDDIKTTGYTLNECAKQLKLSGADSVYALAAVITENDTCKI